jgi:hypothetical protein
MDGLLLILEFHERNSNYLNTGIEYFFSGMDLSKYKLDKE